MAAVLPVTYAELYHVVTNDPHDGDPSAIYEDETPVPVGGVRAKMEKLFQPYAETLTQTRTYCSQEGEMGYPLRASSCRPLCFHTVEDALRASRGPQLRSSRT